MLTPQQIEQKRFTNTRFKEGYDQEEVDTFLDRVNDDYSKLYDCYQRQKHGGPVTAATQVIKREEPEPPSEMIAKILKVAEDTAQQHIHEGKVQAEEIRLKAKDERNTLMAEAASERQRLMDQATAERHQAIGELEDKRAKIQARVDELVKAEEEITARLRKALEGWS